MRAMKKLLTMLLTLCLVVGCIGLIPIKAAAQVDVSESVSLDAWGDQAELKFTNLFLGAGVLPTFEYGAMDKDTYKYVQEYIAINGVTVKDINANTDTSGYEFTVFPSTIGAPYNVPVILFQDAQNITIKIHGAYLATLETVSITVKAGLSFENGDNTYVVGEDITFDLQDGIWVKRMAEVDVTDMVALEGWNDQAELKYTNLFLGEGVLPTFGYGAIDGAYTYLQEYITVNGRTVADINANTDTSSYTFTVFPSTIGAPYNLPVMLFQDGANLTIKVHSTYLGTSEALTIGIKQGLYVDNGAKKYTVSEDLNFVLTDGAWVLQKTEVDVTEAVSITGWNTQENLQYAQIFFGEGVLPGFAYGAIDGAYTYLQEYITVNGRTVADINANTDTSDYTFTVFPSTENDTYRVPVILLQDGNNLTIKVHQNYLAANADVEIGIKANIYLDVDRTSYVVKDALLFHWNGEAWAIGHKEVTVPGKAAEVGKTGLTEGVKCSACGKVLKEQKVIAAKTLAKPDASKITKATGGKKKLTIKFKKVKSITRYEIQIATKKNMKKGLKTYKVSSGAEKYVAKKLKPKTNYFIRIRTVKTVNGITKTSAWSKVVKAKTK